MKFFLYLGFFFLSFVALAQNPKIKGLEAQLKTATTPEEQIELYIKLSKEYRNISFEQSLGYAKKAKELAKQNGDSTALSSAFNSIGVAYDLYGNYSKATSYYYKSLRISEAIGDSTGMSTNYNNIANIFDIRNDIPKSIEYYNKSLEIARAIKDTASVARAIINLGSSYQLLGQSDKALFYLKEGSRLYTLVKNEQGIVMSANNLGFIHSERGEWKTAITQHNRALELATNSNNYLDVAYSLSGLAVANFTGKQYDKALQYALENLRILKELNSKDEIQIAAMILNDIYLEKGDYRKAHEYLTLHSQYKDSVHNAAIDLKITELQLTYRNEKAEQENQLLKVERRLKNQQLERNTIIQVCILALLLIACMAAFVFFRSRQHLHGINQLLMQNSVVLSQQKAELTDQAKLLHDQKEELEKLNTVKDRLFSVIAHDLKGPLVSLKGLLHIAATGSVPEDKFKMLLAKLETSQQNALWLLDNLLVWAKTQMRGIAFRPKNVNAHTLAQETLHLLQPQAQQKSITLHNNIDEADVVTADPETTKIVFRNLISNAIKFSYTGGAISLNSVRIPGYLELSVTDEGVGIQQDVIDKLFVARNYSSSGTANEKGSGLGLALCKEFIEQNGGFISVESKFRNGSTFKFTLPLAADAVDQPTKTQPVLESELY